MKDLGLSADFFARGGTEFACMSTSASQAVACDFAASRFPLIFKFVTPDFMSRGADIAFLSVYESEAEVLYPPLTYLRSKLQGHGERGDRRPHNARGHGRAHLPFVKRETIRHRLIICSTLRSYDFLPSTKKQQNLPSS